MEQSEIKFSTLTARSKVSLGIPGYASLPECNRRWRSVGHMILRNLEFGEKIDTIPDPIDESKETSINAMGDAHNDIFDLATMGASKKELTEMSPNDYVDTDSKPE